MSEAWDVIIIGGGPGGSTCATTLAKAGQKVLVIEKAKFPRFHVGESLLPYNRTVFDELGLWPKLESAGFMQKRGAQFWLGDSSRRVRVTFGQGMFTEFPEAFQVERARFDKILLDHAQETGAVVSEETLMLDYAIRPDGVTVKVRAKDGSEREEHGQFLVDASGLANMTGNREKLREYYKGHRKIAVFSHFSNVVMPTGEEHGDILIVRRENSWVWFIPLDDEKTSVGLVLDLDEFRNLGKEPAEAFEHAVQTTPELKRRLEGATRLMDFHSVSDFSYTNKEFVSPRLVRVGDSAGFIDPIFSSGVFLAMQSGLKGGRVVHEALEKKAALTPAMHAYEKEARRSIRVYWEFIEKYYTHAFTQVFFQPAPKWELPSAVNAILAGRTRLPWKAWWRLRMFFLIVWLQKRFTIVRPFSPSRY